MEQLSLDAIVECYGNLICKQTEEGIMSYFLLMLAEKFPRRQKRLASVFGADKLRGSFPPLQAASHDQQAADRLFCEKRPLLYDCVSAHLALDGSIIEYDFPPSVMSTGKVTARRIIRWTVC